jgi:short subunit dehydrogenase-like uncharacterized protein
VRDFLKKKIDAGPAGPDAEQRRRGFSRFWGEVRSLNGQRMTSCLDTIDGYGLTALTAWDIAKRTLNGQAQPGFQTPSRVFGADYILSFAGSKRIDL